MLTAIDENNKIINLLELERKELTGKFYCPSCHAELLIKNGQIKVLHFAHKSLKSCNLWLENESEQHLGLKKILYQWFKRTDKVEIERYLPELNQRPDLLVNDKIAIEIQCSHLSIKRLKERTENYKAHGFKVLWLMGKDLWLAEQVTKLQKNLVYFSENRGFFYWELDFQRKKLRLKSLIHEDLPGRIICLQEEIPFGKGRLIAHLRLPYLAQKLVKIPTFKDPKLSSFIRQQLYYQSPKWMKIQEKYYQKGENLLTKKFEGPYIAPLGLNLLESFTDEMTITTFTQIDQNVKLYYENFLINFQRNSLEMLYPPCFYAIMGKQKKEK
ncbi:competence protein CoiA [Lactococcus cremoris]|uniref:competence protein CoiA n=1 Tax=Lactococcus lactis subsp. cremoris TaxID=1359 RepID=UPI002FC9A549